MALRFVLAAVALAGGFCVASTACSSFTGEEDPASGDDSAAPPASEGSTTVPEAGGGADARPNIDCDATFCRAPDTRYIFLTLGSLQGDFAADAGAAGALAVADQFCSDQADHHQDKHPDLAGRSWHAWICTETEGAVGRVVTGDNTWIRADGRIVFPSSGALKVGFATTPIDDAQSFVWTGCGNQPPGEKTSATCTSWTTTTGSGAAGIASHVDALWSFIGIATCTDRYPIYCFESE